jgi:hypothetical protein
MYKKAIITLMTLLMIFVIVATVLMIRSEYEPFTLNEEGCLHKNKACFCLGNLHVMESFPPKYDCKGWESCKEINITECPEKN